MHLHHSHASAIQNRPTSSPTPSPPNRNRINVCRYFLQYCSRYANKNYNSCSPVNPDNPDNHKACRYTFLWGPIPPRQSPPPQQDESAHRMTLLACIRTPQELGVGSLNHQLACGWSNLTSSGDCQKRHSSLHPTNLEDKQFLCRRLACFSHDGKASSA